MSKKPVSVISILTWDGIEYVSELIRNLKAVPIGTLPYLIVIMDQGSDKDVIKVLTEFAQNTPNVHLELSEKNKGFSVGHNQNFERIWKTSAFDYFVVVNSDVIFDEKYWLDLLVNHMEAHPNTGGASPHALGMKENGHGRAATQQEIETHTYNSISACVAIYRVSDICRYGLFDAKFTPGYFEDTDLSYRFKNYGRDMDYVKIKFRHCYLGKKFSTSGIKRKELLAKYGNFQEKNRIEFLSRWIENNIAPDSAAELVQKFPTIYFPSSKGGGLRVIKGPARQTENQFSYDIGVNSELIIHPTASIRARAHFEIHDGGTVSLGARTVIGVNNWIQGNGGIEIGDDTLIGANTVLLSTMHGVDRDLPIRSQPLRKNKLTIKNDVLIGANVTVAAGVTLDTGAVIGSNSFVNHDVESYSIVGGVPAKKLRSREIPVCNRKALAVVAVGNSDRPNRFNTHTNFYANLGRTLHNVGVESHYLCHPESRGNHQLIPPNRQHLAFNHDNFNALLDEIDPDWIFIWNGNSDGDQITAAVAETRGIPIIYSELGWFTQQDSVYFDSCGTNAKSEIRNLDLNKIEESPDLDDWVNNFLAERIRHPVAGPEYTFVPLQDEADTNILQFSPYKKMQEFVTQLAEKNPDTLFVVRPHPKAPVKLSKKNKNIKVIEGGNLYDWLASAKAVVGINSTVLLEALLLGKVVHSVGTSLITGLDVFFEYDSVEDIDLGASYDTSRWSRRRKLLSELIFRRQMLRSDISDINILKNHPVLQNFI